MLFRFDPATSRLFPPCPSRWLTGLSCPGCGTLRSLHRLLHGDLAGAVRMNGAAVVAIPVVLWYLASKLRTARGGRPLPGAALFARSGWWIAGVLLAWMIARNLPWPPFTALAPH